MKVNREQTGGGKEKKKICSDLALIVSDNGCSDVILYVNLAANANGHKLVER